MGKKCITVENAPAALGPYSHAVSVGDLLFISGQGPIHPDGSGILKGTFEEEARLTLDNVKAVLEGGGSSLDAAIKITIFLKDMDNFAELNGIYKEYFPENCPARSCVQVARLPADFQIEIEAIGLVQ